MPAIAVWTIALVAVAGVVGLLTLMAISLGRASSHADEESDRQMAEYQQAKREQVLAKAQADAEAEEQVEAEAELQAELQANAEGQTTEQAEAHAEVTRESRTEAEA